MAAFDRQNPNLDDFVGFKWSSWIEKANILTSEEECKYERKRTETMTLRKEDMYIYGHCPAHDDFYLVVCSHCGQVVKPQAFEKHCERRHGLISQLCSPLSSSAHQQCPWPVHPPSLVQPSREKLDSRHQKAWPPSTTPSLTQYRPAEPQKDEVGLPPAENLSQEASSSLLSNTSSPLPWVSSLQSGPKPPEGTHSPTPEQLLLQRTTAGQPEDNQPAPQGPRTYSRTFKKVYRCDLDKHCGMLDPVRKKPCTRQLMCNIQSIHQRQKVEGRRKTFDQLLTEQRPGSKGPDLARSQVCKDPLKKPSPHTQAPGDLAGPQHHRLSPNNCSIHRTSKLLESGEDEEEETRVEVQPPYPFNQSLPSSEGSDSEDQEVTDLPFAPWHPRPLGLCNFGSHTMGCNVFTFDRRCHHLRIAFSAMVEHHLSSHLWKKLPQMTGLRSYQAAATSLTSTRLSVKAGRRAAPTTGPPLRTPFTQPPHRAADRENCSSGSASSGQPQSKSSQHNLPSSTLRHPSLASGLGRPCNPVGRPSKAHLRERKLMRANLKKSKPPHDEGRALKRARDHLLQERDWSPAPAKVYPSASFQGPINGALTTLGKKPCLLPHPSERYSPSPGLGKRPLPPPLRPSHPSPNSRGRPPGLHRMVVGHNLRGLVKKCKSNNGSPPHNPPAPSPP